MKVIFAQGNPGAEYARTRHNVGWRFLDAYAEKAGVQFATKSKFYADVAELSINQQKHLLMKPTTFYNDGGRAARSIADFYKLSPEDFLIVHDELALPLGTLRTRVGGSDAGNNGIKSLNAHLGEASARLRIGIFDADVPRDALGSVLGKFTSDEEKVLDELSPKIFAVFDDFLSGNFSTTTHKEQD